MNQPQFPFVDTGNSLLTQVPAELHTGTVSTPAGELGVLTIRTSSTTCTVFLGKEDLRSWAQLLTGLAGEVGGSLLTASPGDIALLRH